MTGTVWEHPGLHLLGFVRERSFGHLGEDRTTPIEGWTSNAIQLTLIF